MLHFDTTQVSNISLNLAYGVASCLACMHILPTSPLPLQVVASLCLTSLKNYFETAQDAESNKEKTQTSDSDETNIHAYIYIKNLCLIAPSLFPLASLIFGHNALTIYSTLLVIITVTKCMGHFTNINFKLDLSPLSNWTHNNLSVIRQNQLAENTFNALTSFKDHFKIPSLLFATQVLAPVSSKNILSALICAFSPFSSNNNSSQRNTPNNRS